MKSPDMVITPLHNFQDSIALYDKSFSEYLCENCSFEIKSKLRQGIRSICYDVEEHTLLVSHVRNNRVHVLNLSTGSLRWFDHHGTTVRNIKMNGREIVTSGWDGRVCVTDFDSLKPRLILTEKGMGRCPESDISPDRNFLYSYSYDSDLNPYRTANTVRQWYMSDGNLKKKFLLPGKHLSVQRCGSCKVFGNRLYVVSDTGHFHIFDCRTGRLVAEHFSNELFQSMCVVPEYDMLVVGGSSGNIYLFSASGQLIRRKVRAHDDEVTRVIRRPGHPESVITSSFDGTLKFWEIPGMRLIRKIGVNKVNLWTVAFVNDLLVAGGEDEAVFVFDIKDDEKVTFKGKLFVSRASYALIPNGARSFYSNDLSVMRVVRHKGAPVSDPVTATYLLNTACDFRLFRDFFSNGNQDRLGLPSKPGGYFQLTR